MELTSKQQASELIKKSQRILLLTPSADGDSVGAMISLFLIFKKLNKEPMMVCPEDIPANLNFLPQIDQIKKDFAEINNFVISLNCQKTKVSKLSYKVEGSKLNIIVTPSGGSFAAADISTNTESAGVDLMIVVDAASLDMLGKLYDDNAEIFYQTPVLNIDHHATNDYFGKVNLVDLTATSTCEILVSIIEALGEEKTLIDEEIATALLAGVITDTGSFQNSNTTPKSFTVSAQLIAQGARQQEIIKNVYKTKPLSQLRLWGRILAQIREDKENKIIWSLVSIRDLEQTGARESEISGVMNELQTTAPEADIVLLISQSEGGISGSIRTTKSVDATEIAKIFGGGGHPQAAGFKLTETSLAMAEREIIEKVRQYQQRKLSQVV